MKSKLLKLSEWLLASFDNVNAGASGKKLTAFAVTAAYCYSHRYCDATNIGTVLTIDAGFISVLFGINVVDKLKNPTNENNQDKPEGN